MKNVIHNHLEAIRTGNSTGVKEIYTQFFPRISYFITKNGGSKDDAQDIFQDAILVIYEKAQSPEFNISSSFYTFLYGVCRNLFGNKLQKKSSKEVTLPDQFKLSSEEDIECNIFKLEENQLFWDAFQQLGQDCQKLLTLFFDKVKMKEITKLMGFGSENYAKKRKFQCKEKLITLIKSDARFEELKN